MSWFSRLVNALNTRRLDEDLAEEMTDHLERRAAALHEKGINAEEAQRKARLRFGNATRLREESRGFRLWAGLEGTLQDIRFAWRGMRKTPAFTATAVLSLALAIGANTAIYSIVDAAILRPLPVTAREQLFTLSWPDISDPGSPMGEERVSFSYPEYLQFATVSRRAARLALFSGAGLTEAREANRGAQIERINREFASEKRSTCWASHPHWAICSRQNRIVCRQVEPSRSSAMSTGKDALAQIGQLLAEVSKLKESLARSRA